MYKYMLKVSHDSTPMVRLRLIFDNIMSYILQVRTVRMKNLQRIKYDDPV